MSIVGIMLFPRLHSAMCKNQLDFAQSGVIYLAFLFSLNANIPCCTHLLFFREMDHACAPFSTDLWFDLRTF